MRKPNSSPEKVRQALELLNEAAQEKGEELYEYVTASIKSKTGDIKRRAEETLEEGQKKIEEIDEKVHEHPWAVLGVIALGAFIFGATFSRKK